MIAAVTVRTVAMVAGPLVGLGYLVGTIPWRIIYRRLQLRRELTADRALTARRAQGRDDEIPAVAAEAIVPVLLAMAIQWWIQSIAPGGRGVFDNSSAIAIQSNQALAVWDSTALWFGAAAVFGHIAPVWSRLRGGTGVPPTMGLAVWFAPWVFVTTIGGYLLALALLRERGPAIVAGLAVGLTWSWAGWVWELNPAWGVLHGPELTLWCSVMVAFVAPRVLNAPEYEKGESPD